MEAREHRGGGLRCVTVEPDGFDPDRAYPLVVLLHGYGASMRDLLNLAPAIDARGYVYLFPNAPIEMDIGYGMTGYAWTSIGPDSPQGEAAAAEALLRPLIDETAALYRADSRIVLGGFSQGGMMTYRLGLPSPELFAGLAVLSGGVSAPDELAGRLPPRRDQPIFVAHGTEDAVISIDDARRSTGFVREQGYSPEYHEYAIAHEISQEVVRDLRAWMRRVLPPDGGAGAGEEER